MRAAAGCIFIAIWLAMSPGIGGASPAAPADERAPRPQVEANAGHGEPRPWLGVQVQELDETLASALDFSGGGVLVARVRSGSPAARAGVRAGDVITQVGDGTVESRQDLAHRVRSHRTGDVILLHVWRDGRERELEVTLGAEPARSGSSASWWPAAGYLGAHVAPLSPELASYFGVEPESGVLVLAIDEGSPAAVADLKAGDVITRFGGRSIRSPADLEAALNAEPRQSPVTILVVRHGRERAVEVELTRTTSIERVLDRMRLGRRDLDSLAADLRGSMKDGQERMSDHLQQLEDLLRELERKLDELIDRDEQ